MKQRISKQTIRKVLTVFKNVLKQNKLTFSARTLSEVFDTKHTAIILPTKKIQRIPGSGSSFSKIRFILKSGRKPKGLLSLNPSGTFSHFSFGQEAAGFSKTLNHFIRQKKLKLSDVLVIKAFHSGEYFFWVKVGKRSLQFFDPQGKAFVVTSRLKIISQHNRQIQLLSDAQKEYVKMKQVAKKKRLAISSN